MIRINVQYFYRLATSLRPLVDLEIGTTIDEAYSQLYQAEVELNTFLFNTVIPPDTSYQSGYNLLQVIRSLMEQVGEDKELNAQDVSTIGNGLRLFENIFAAEYARKDTFFVSKKGIYSTTELIESAANMFAPEILIRISDAVADIDQAGRCLAFELPTAAGFHIFRAVESVSKQYVTVFRGTPPTGKNEMSLGNHIRILRTTDADERVVETLDQIRKLHRNPVMHPEQSLTMSEVQSLLGVASSLIQSMVAGMERKAPTPDPTIAQMLPDPNLLDPEDEENEPEGNSGSSSASSAASS